VYTIVCVWARNCQCQGPLSNAGYKAAFDTFLSQKPLSLSLTLSLSLSLRPAADRCLRVPPQNTIRYDIYNNIRAHTRARAECRVIYYVYTTGCVDGCIGLRQNLIVNARGTIGGATFSLLADVVFRAINHSAERYHRRHRRLATETPSPPPRKRCAPTSRRRPSTGFH